MRVEAGRFHEVPTGRSPEGRSRGPARADRIRPTLLAILILSALPFGSAQDAWRWLLITALGSVFALFLWSGIPVVAGRREKIALGLGCAWLAWLGLQIVPLPAPLIERLSPEAHRLYRIAIPGWGETGLTGYAYPREASLEPSAVSPSGGAAGAGWVTPTFSARRPISLYPYGTWRNLLQTAALIGFVVMTLSLFRERRHQRWLAAAIVGLAAFQALYGSLELLSERQHIFGYEKRFYTESATGTLVNRNHFAALLNLALPLMVVLLLEHTGRGPASLRGGLSFAPASRKWRRAAGALRRPVLLLLVIATGTAVVLSRSRMGFAAMLAGLLSLSVLLAWQGRALLGTGTPGAARGPSRMRWAWVPVLLLAGICLYSLAADPLPTIERFLLLKGDLKSGAMRPELWAESLPLVSDYLWTGAGSGAWPVALNPALARLPVAGFWDFHHAHNDYLEILITAGVIGTLLCGGAVAALLIRRPASLAGLAAMAGLATLVVHSAVDFPLAIPSNALLACAVLCLIALPGQGAGSTDSVHGGARIGVAGTDDGSGSMPHKHSDERLAAMPGSGRSSERRSFHPRNTVRAAASLLVLGAVIVWPARSTLAAAMAGKDLANEATPAEVGALTFASRLEPWNDRHVRRLGHAMLSRALESSRDTVVLGDTMGDQARRLRLGMLKEMAAAHRALLRCVDLAPVDYTLHATLARTSSFMRAIARDSGLEAPGGDGILSPYLASAALGPTAFENQIALALLLWDERQAAGEPAASAALDLLDRIARENRLPYEWKRRFVLETSDAPSLARLDQAVRPPPWPYAELASSRAGQAGFSLASCVTALRARAAVREAGEAIERARKAPGTEESRLNIDGARGLLRAVIDGEFALPQPADSADRDPCGGGALPHQDVAGDARRLLASLEG